MIIEFECSCGNKWDENDTIKSSNMSFHWEEKPTGEYGYEYTSRCSTCGKNIVIFANENEM